MFDGYDPVMIWVVLGIVALGAFLSGLACGSMTVGIRSTRRQIRHATVVERIETAKQTGVETWRGQAPVAVEGQPATPMELPRRECVIPVPDRPAVLEPEPLLTVAPTSVDLVVYEPQPAAQQPDGFDEMLEAAKAFEAESLAAIRDPQSAPEPRLDLADLHDVEPDDDEPDDELPPPAGGEPLCAEAPAEPRYAWAYLSGEKLPERGPWRAPTIYWSRKKPIRVRRLDTAARVWLTARRERLRRLLAVGRELDPRGWAPGEARRIIGRHRPEFVEHHRVYPKPMGRVLRPGWKDMLDPPQVPSFPGWGCVPR